MHTIKAGGDACGQKMCEPMEKTMDRLGTGVFLALLLPGCMFLVAVLLICGGACLLYKS